MAVQKINYENKEAIQNDTDIANKNKVTDADMNEIKTVVNNNANELQELQNKEVNNSTDIEQLKRNTLELQTNVNNIQQEQATQNQKILNNSNNLDLVADQLGETEQGFLQYKLENNQRVTYAEQNIIDLQGRERLNKENIETLQQEVQELEQDVKANAIEEETEQAKSLKITDASGARGKIIVFGNSEQETREGYNMYDYSKDVMPSGNGLTIDFDEKTAYLIISGTPSSDYQYITKRQDITNKLENGETYTLYAENITTGVYVQITKSKDGSSEYIVPKNNTITFVADTSYKYELDIQTSTVASTGQLNNYKTRYMLYKGTESKEFQLAGASPSINYPSKVQCLGSNKNLVTEVLNNLWYNEDTNKFITMQNTVSVIAEIPQNTNITINKKNGGNRFAVVTSNIKPTTGIDNSVIFIDNENLNRKTYTFKNTDKKWVWVGVQNGGTEEDKQKAIEEIKIEEGEIATSYSPYGQGSTEIKQYNKNLAESIEIFSTSGQYGTMCIAGYTIKKGEKYIINFNTPNSGTDCYLQDADEIKLEHGDYYHTNLDGTRKSIVVTALATGYIRSTKGIILKRTNDNKETGLISNFMIEKWNGSNTASSYKETEKDVFLLDIQQEMLKGDYFDLNRKKEVHTWEKYEITGNESWSIANAGTANYFYQFTIKDKLNKVNQDVLPFSNCYKGARVITINSEEGVFVTIDATIRIREEKEDTIEAFKAKLQDLYNNGTPVYVWYKLSTPIELDLTPDQIEVLEKLNKLRFFKGTNNILTTEDIALLQAIYPVNLKNVNNKMQEEIDEIKELLSTTQTSAMLLDNLEQDLIKEVE